MSEDEKPLNVMEEPLESCSMEPVTGFFRNGSCMTDERDHGKHTVCAVMTEDFLEYTKSKGNDLSSPNPTFGFPGLKPGDKWCLCAARWLEAYEDGKAPLVNLQSTEISTLEVVPKQALIDRAMLS